MLHGTFGTWVRLIYLGCLFVFASEALGNVRRKSLTLQFLRQIWSTQKSSRTSISEILFPWFELVSESTLSDSARLIFPLTYILHFYIHYKQIETMQMALNHPFYSFAFCYTKSRFHGQAGERLKIYLRDQNTKTSRPLMSEINDAFACIPFGWVQY